MRYGILTVIYLQIDRNDAKKESRYLVALGHLASDSIGYYKLEISDVKTPIVSGSHLKIEDLE